MKQAQRNETAYTLGFLFGFFGICGVAHMYKGKTTESLFWIFIKGPLHFVVAVAVNCTVIGLMTWSSPFWIGTVQRQADEGASLVHA